MASPGVSGLLKGLGDGLATVGEMGVRSQYEDMRMKKQHQYGLEEINVRNKNAIGSQDREFANRAETLANQQAFSVEQAAKESERQAGLLKFKQAHDASESALDRKSRELIADKDSVAQASRIKSDDKAEKAEYFNQMIKVKSAALKSLQGDYGLDPEINPEGFQRAKQLEQEIASLSRQYAQTVGIEQPTNDNKESEMVQQVLFANPTWDENKARAYLKHLGKL